MARKEKAVVEANRMPPTEGQIKRYRSIEGLRERYRIGEEYGIILMSKEESYPTEKPGNIVLSLDMMEAGFRLPVPDIAKELLRHWKIAPIQLTPNSWRTIFAFYIICKTRGLEPTLRIFRSHFSLANSPQSGFAVVYTKHRMNRIQIHVSPGLSNNKGWDRLLFAIGKKQGASVLSWDSPTRVMEPLGLFDSVPFLIRDEAKTSMTLNTTSITHVE